MTDNGRIRIEPSGKRVRAILGGETIVDSINTLMVWEVPYYPTYYFPEGDVKMDALVESGETKRSPSRGDATLYQVKAGGKEGQAYGYLEPKIEELAGHIALVWPSMDYWFEEDEEVFTHPRDPYTRIDIVPSSRRVRVELDGVTQPAPAPRYSRTPGEIQGPAARVGEHSEEVLRDWGFSSSQIAKLRASAAL